MITEKFFKYLFLLIFFVSIFTAFLYLIAKTAIAAPTNAVFHPNPVIGLVDGKVVTFEDVRNKKANDLSLKLYQHLSVRLMEYALKKLSSKHPEIYLTPERKVTHEEIIAVYEQNELQQQGTLEQMRPQIKQFLERQIMSQHMLNQYSLALKKGWVISNLEAPSDFLINGNIKSAYLRGNKKASVVLLEYSDYQCPFCGRVQSTIQKLLEKYQDRVAFGYRHFPLSFHKEADEAAIAAECAREQKKFEDFHQLLYSRQKEHDKEDLKKYAREIKVKDPMKFDKCLDNEKYRGLVNQDMKDGSILGITGTPGFFVGHFNAKSGEIRGEVLSGAQPYDIFQKTLEKYLSKNWSK